MPRYSRSPAALALLIVLLLIASQRSSIAAVPTCAVLPDSRSGVAKDAAALLEADSTGVKLVERAAVERVLQEQTLTAVASPGGVTDRVKLGGLLHADVLVTLLSTDTHRLQITICETAGGLRLLSDSVAAPVKDAKPLRELLQRALAKRDEGIERICAVPPLVSNDLERAHDALQGGYARAIESTLLAQRHVLVVELQEAKAIANDIVLSDGRTIQRRLPLYLLGEYRNHGLGASQRVELKLTARQGERDVAHYASGELMPDQAAKFLRESALRAIGAPLDVAGADLSVEAAQLAQRAATFQQLGSWNEALELTEASLLLKPDQPRLHYEAVNILSHLPAMGPDVHNLRDFAAATVVERLDYYAQQIPHLELYLRATDIGADQAKRVEEANFLAHACGGQGRIFFLPAEARPRFLELDRRKRDMIFDVLEAKKRAGQTHFTNHSFEHFLLIGIGSDEEDREVRLRDLCLFAGLPGFVWKVDSILTIEKSPDEQQSPRFEALLDYIDKNGSDDIKQAVRSWRESKQQHRTTVAVQATREATPTTSSTSKPVRLSFPDDRRADLDVTSPPIGSVHFKHIQFTSVDDAGNSLPVPERFTQYFSCGRGIDAAVALKDLFLIKEKDKLRRVYHSDERFFNFMGACFDGRYLWAPVKRPEPMLLVIDSQTEKVWTLGQADGLPSMSHGVRAVGLEPGRICLAGAFGRSWIANVTFSPAQNAKVDVFFEARDAAADDFNNDAWKNVHLAFTPTWMFALAPAPSAQPAAATRSTQHRVVIGRVYYPLIVDPDARRVEVVPDSVGSTTGGNNFDSDGTSLYWAVPVLGREPPRTLWRFGFPEFNRITLKKNLPSREGVVFVDGPRTHLIGEHWWTAPTSDAPFAPLRGDAPGATLYRSIAHSEHYGIVLVSRSGSEQGAFQVELAME